MRGKTYCYEIVPINFLLLTDAKQDETVDMFKRLVNTLTKPIKIIILKTSKTIAIGGRPFKSEYYRFFIESVGEPIDTILEACGFAYQPVTSIPQPKMIKAFSKYVALEGGRLAKTCTILKLPGTLVEGFLSETYGYVDQIIIKINPLPQELAVARFRKYLRLLKSMILADQSSGRMPSEDVVYRKNLAEATFNKLLSGATRLFEVTTNLTVTGGDFKTVNENFRQLKAILQARLIRVDAPLFAQHLLFAGEIGKKLILDTDTLGAFFPFVSADVIEVPNGIFLGINRLTGAPVIFDPAMRMNYNMLIAGKSGSGKSFLSKIIITRFIEKHPKAALFVIDPENEYGLVGRAVGAKVVEITRRKGLGLDPLALFGESKDSAANILADLVNIQKPELHSELRTIVGRARSLEEVYRRASKSLKAYLRSLLEGPDNFLVSGEPMKFTTKMVFDLHTLHREFTIAKKGTMTLQAASVLLFSKIWQLLEDPTFIPINVPKLVVVDEVWLYTSMPAAAAFLEGVARRGRKRNVFFVLNTQRVADVLESVGGRALLENCATKVLLRQDEAAIKLVSEIVDLSAAEREALLEFSPGQGILIAENIHIPVNFLATPEEYKLFTTKPTEWIKSR